MITMVLVKLIIQIMQLLSANHGPAAPGADRIAAVWFTDIAEIDIFQAGLTADIPGKEQG